MKWGDFTLGAVAGLTITSMWAIVAFDHAVEINTEDWLGFAGTLVGVVGAIFGAVFIESRSKQQKKIEDRQMIVSLCEHMITQCESVEKLVAIDPKNHEFKLVGRVISIQLATIQKLIDDAITAVAATNVAAKWELLSLREFAHDRAATEVIERIGSESELENADHLKARASSVAKLIRTKATNIANNFRA